MLYLSSLVTGQFYNHHLDNGGKNTRCFLFTLYFAFMASFVIGTGKCEKLSQNNIPVSVLVSQKLAAEILHIISVPL